MCWGWSIQDSKGRGYRGLYMNLGGEGVPGWWITWVGGGRGPVLGQKRAGCRLRGYRGLYMSLGGEGMPVGGSMGGWRKGACVGAGACSV